jgi:hypothetical protein
METYDIPFKGLISEISEWADDYSKKIFRDKVFRVYIKCLTANKILLATKIYEKYRKELTSTLRSDLSISMQYSLFVQNLFKP